VACLVIFLVLFTPVLARDPWWYRPYALPLLTLGANICIFAPTTIWPLYLSYKHQRLQRLHAHLIERMTKLHDWLVAPKGFEVFLHFCMAGMYICYVLWPDSIDACFD
jgi:hypothetical protein